MEYETQADQAIGYGVKSVGRAIGLTQGLETRPLTADIMDRARRNREQAFEVQSRLSDLRDRLFGMSPQNAVAGANSPPKPSLDSFSAAYEDVADDVTRALNNIDRLSMELANRL